MLSDTESSDSDNGIRFKTTSTRNKESYSSPKATTSSSHTNGSNRYERERGDRERDSSWRTRDHTDRRDNNPDRKTRRSSSRDKRHHRSDSREKHNSSRTTTTQNIERRRSKSRERTRESTREIIVKDENRKRDDKEKHIQNIPAKRSVTPISTKISVRPSQTSSRATSVDPNPIVESELFDDKSKIKKSKHKRHKRTKREEGSNGRDIKDDEVVILDDDDDEIDSKTKSSKVYKSNRVEETSHSSSSNKRVDEENSVSVCGPSLPPHLIKPRSKSRDSNASRSLSKDRTLGPAMPPTLSKREMEERSTSQSSGSQLDRKRIIGPAVPPPQFLIVDETGGMSDISETEDYDLIGPIPAGVVSKSEAFLELEKRALELKLAKYTANDKIDETAAREEWMIELPEVKGVAGLGLEPRQFRTKERPDMSDRSSWTDTPRDRENKSHRKEPTSDELKASKQREADALFKARRDDEQEAAAKKHKKKHKRDESLMDMHARKMKKKKKEDDRPSRRPFSRDTDLKVNRFDQSQKTAMMKKAQLLDTRFGSGETKYL